MIGYSLPPAEKRRVWVEARRHCKVAVLELYENGKAELMDKANTFTHRLETHQIRSQLAPLSCLRRIGEVHVHRRVIWV
jgi:hypothetical protein